MRKVIKKILSLLIVVLLFVSIFNIDGLSYIFLKASASTEYTEGKYIYTITDGEATIVGTTDQLIGYVSIPDMLGGCKVTAIGDAAFKNSYNITSVRIGDNVKVIGSEAFSGGCYQISNVTIGKNVTTIGSSAFRYCSALKYITIPDNVTSIGGFAFSSCSSLESVSIGNGVTYIGANAFSSCAKLTRITIPENVSQIGDYAFGGCSKLENITVDENNKNYSNDENGVLFNKDKSLLIKYPEAKSGEVYVIPLTVTTVSTRAFDNCNNLKSITI